MGASFKTLARIQGRVERALAELEDADALTVVQAVAERVKKGEWRKPEAEDAQA